MEISIVILTYNRLSLLRELLRSLSRIKYQPLEIIVVDNRSEEPVGNIIKKEFPNIALLEMTENIGVAARNRGISHASGDIIITLDDDVIGINDDSIANLIEVFADSTIGAVCFKVISSQSNRVTNWCHHYSADDFADKMFLTNEITEGAVAFRKSTLEQSGLYPESFFISHEGPDLAYRIMNKGYHVVYTPKVTVRHYHSKIARKNWRRYYFDTRNLLWLAVRNYPFFFGLKFVFIGLSAMFVYSLRDGFVKYWAKGLIDGVYGLKTAYRERTPPAKRTIEILKKIEKNRPDFFIMLKKRLFQKEISI